MATADKPFTVVFTDLDGTLLDHHDYGSEPAADAIRRLSDAGTPLVFCSSKTRAEIEHVQRQLDIRHPFVSENGGALFIPRGYFAFPLAGVRSVAGYDAVEFGRPYEQVVSLLTGVADRLRVPITGFHNMSIEEVARDCGLPLLAAGLAKLREYDDPFRVLSEDPAARSRFYRAAHAAGLRLTRGGRYDHASGGGDKGTAVAALTRLYAMAHGELRTIGLGDGANDVSLLRAVDVPVIVLNDAIEMAGRLLRKVPTARVTDVAGPKGWAQAVSRALGFPALAMTPITSAPADRAYAHASRGRAL